MKIVELRELNDEELLKKLSDCDEELFNLRFRGTITPIEDPKRMGKLKKTKARIKTLLNERKKKDRNGK